MEDTCSEVTTTEATSTEEICAEDVYAQSDKALSFMRTLLRVFAFIFAIASIVIGIVFWTNASTRTYLYGGAYTMTNPISVALGFAFFFGGPLVSFLTYKIAMFFLWISFDIKVIRSKLCGEEPSDVLKKALYRKPATFVAGDDENQYPEEPTQENTL